MIGISLRKSEVQNTLKLSYFRRKCNNEERSCCLPVQILAKYWKEVAQPGVILILCLTSNVLQVQLGTH